MTRVNNFLRDRMHREIMKDLPSRDFCKEIHALAQSIILDHAPEDVKALYDNPELRKFLLRSTLAVRVGNKSVYLWHGNERHDEVYGLTDGISIRMDDYDNVHRLKEGSLYRELVIKLHKSELVSGYFEQDELRASVSRRLRTNLNAASTFKKLYEILEPELHHYIPKDEVTPQLPACVAPVVDDLRKLGAVLPETPKAVA